MTFDELKKMAHQNSTNVRAFRTVTTLFELSLYQTASLSQRAEQLPAIEDICAVLSTLAQQADDIADKLLWGFPSNMKGFKP